LLSSKSLSSLCDWCVTHLHARFLGDHHLYPNDCLYYCYPNNNDNVNNNVDTSNNTNIDMSIHDESKQHILKHNRSQVYKRDNLPNVKEGYKRIVIISDTHDRHDFIGTIPHGDVLLHCGDILMTSRFFTIDNAKQKLKDFNSWLQTLPFKKDNIFIIGGNHDLYIETLGYEQMKQILINGTYLENEKFYIGNLSCYATPLSSGKSANKAFQSKEFKKKTIESVPDKVDILITHGHCADLETIVDHKIHIWGHAHSAYGIRLPGEYLRNEIIQSLSICAPIMDKHYNLSHLPIILDVPNQNNIPTLSRVTSDKKIKRKQSILSRIFGKKKIFVSDNLE